MSAERKARRLEGLAARIERGSTEGERNAARIAWEKHAGRPYVAAEASVDPGRQRSSPLDELLRNMRENAARSRSSIIFDAVFGARGSAPSGWDINFDGFQTDEWRQRQRQRQEKQRRADEQATRDAEARERERERNRGDFNGEDFDTLLHQYEEAERWQQERRDRRNADAGRAPGPPTPDPDELERMNREALAGLAKQLAARGRVIEHWQINMSDDRIYGTNIHRVELRTRTVK